MVDWKRRAADLADRLVAAGVLHEPAWRRAFESVPRHVFVPRFWAHDGDGRVGHLVTESQPGFIDQVYRDEVLVTLHTGDPDRTPISSSSAPSAIALMLEALDPHPGERVLEIGTGTGYNAALLSHRLGDAAVTSIDIDAELISLAGARLASLGLHPSLVVGDGMAGVPEEAPYDGIIATCATTGIPAAWVAQLAPDGRIVAPMTFGGALPVLVKTGAGTASGHFHRSGFGFMPLHPSGQPTPDGYEVPVPSAVLDHETRTDLGEAELGDTDFMLWLRLEVPESRLSWQHDSAGARVGLLIHTATRRAEVTFGPAGRHRVMQGADLLFNEVVEAWRRWGAFGRPPRDHLGMTATADGEQWVWMNSPASAVRWAIPR
jgi:protein-L-isoaspartate O-methyltransferase